MEQIPSQENKLERQEKSRELARQFEEIEIVSSNGEVDPEKLEEALDKLSSIREELRGLALSIGKTLL